MNHEAATKPYTVSESCELPEMTRVNISIVDFRVEMIGEAF